MSDRFLFYFEADYDTTWEMISWCARELPTPRCLPGAWGPPGPTRIEVFDLADATLFKLRWSDYLVRPIGAMGVPLREPGEAPRNEVEHIGDCAAAFFPDKYS